MSVWMDTCARLPAVPVWVGALDRASEAAANKGLSVQVYFRLGLAFATALFKVDALYFLPAGQGQGQIGSANANQGFTRASLAKVS